MQQFSSHYDKVHTCVTSIQIVCRSDVAAQRHEQSKSLNVDAHITHSAMCAVYSLHQVASCMGHQFP